MKTEERLAVPCDEKDLIDEVKALLPEGQVVALGDRGITDLPLARLTAWLAPHGYVTYANKGRDVRQLVGCTDEDGRVEQFGLEEHHRPEVYRTRLSVSEGGSA